MRLSQQYNIVYEKTTGKQGYINGMITEENYEAVCKAHKTLKDELEQLKSVKPEMDKVYEMGAAAMLGSLKQILTGQEKIEIQL